ncbi:MAG: cyclase family protein [Actinomycetia bacterium]|nr:cyclase family protein [Actinomycetes bacterium]
MAAEPAGGPATGEGRQAWDFELIDLTRPLTRKTVEALFGDLYTAEPYFSNISAELAMDFTTGNSTAWLLTIPDHVSTHIDAPVHMVEGGATLEDVDIAGLFGEAVVLDLRMDDPNHGYTPADLEHAEPTIERGDIVLIYSGFEDAAASERMRQTHLTEEAALWLIERGVKSVGVEPSGIEHTPDGMYVHGWYKKGAANPWPAHNALLGNDVYIIEGLTNLDRIAGRRVKFAALPVPMPGLSGFPVRAVAWTD